MSVAWHKAFEISGKNFRPAPDYAENNINYRIQYGNGLSCGSSVFIDLLLAEIRLREEMQAKERLLTECGALQSKEFHVHTEPPQYDDRLEKAHKEVSLRIIELYQCESMLPNKPLRQMYNELRRNPKWYLRKELVDDCIQRGGCCARKCGCCEKRLLTADSETRKGIGHCTVECGCCAKDRRCEFTEEEKQKFAKATKDLLCGPNPSYLLTMADSFFSEIDQSHPELPQNQASTDKGPSRRLWRKMTNSCQRKL